MADDPAVLSRLNHRLRAFGVEVAVDPSGTRGRCLLASKDLKPGDVVLSSSPFAIAPLAQLAPTRCGACFERSPNLMRCGGCKRVFFCTKSCQKTAWSAGHKRWASNFPPPPLPPVNPPNRQPTSFSSADFSNFTHTAEERKKKTRT